MGQYDLPCVKCRGIALSIGDRLADLRKAIRQAERLGTSEAILRLADLKASYAAVRQELAEHQAVAHD